MSADWHPSFYGMESSSAVQPKEKDVEKVGSASNEGTLIKLTVGKDTESIKDDAKTIQDKKDVLIEVSKAATEKELKGVILDIKRNTLWLNRLEQLLKRVHSLITLRKKPLKSQRMVPKLSKMRMIF